MTTPYQLWRVFALQLHDIETDMSIVGCWLELPIVLYRTIGGWRIIYPAYYIRVYVRSNLNVEIFKPGLDRFALMIGSITVSGRQ